MQDKLDQLENKLVALIDRIAQLGESQAALEQEKSDLEELVKVADEKIAGLEKEKEDLQKQCEETAAKENEMRDRIHSIIERIDRVEGEITSGQAGEDTEQ
jgi:chromosome segregation ATPase